MVNLFLFLLAAELLSVPALLAAVKIPKVSPRFRSGAMLFISALFPVGAILSGAVSALAPSAVIPLGNAAEGAAVIPKLTVLYTPS